MSSSKIDRALKGPGLFEITLGVLLSIILGVVLAALHLLFKPVEVVAEIPAEHDAGAVYFVEGAINSSKSRQWMRKRQMLADGAAVDVSFNEEELNAWMANLAPQKGEAASTELVVPEKVNFRIRGGIFQVGLLSKVNALGLTRDLVFQTRGTFQPGDAGFVFHADEFFIGSLPTHTVPGLKQFLIKRALASQEIPEDLKTTWSKLKLVAVEDTTLRLSLP